MDTSGHEGVAKVFAESLNEKRRFIVVFTILLVLFASSCNTINSKLQDEYIRPGLSQGMCGVFDKYRIIARELYWSVSGKLWERAEMPFLRLNGKSELREICK